MTPELKTSCEMVFQEHKTSSVITWKKNAFRGRMSIGLCEMAKETLVQKKIIYFPKPAKKTTTVLNPDVAGAVSFEEAAAMIQSKLPMPSPVSNAGKFDICDDTDFREFNLEKNTTNVLSADLGITGEKWYLRPLFYYVVWPLTSAVLSILIAFLMSKSVEMTFR